MGKTKNDYTDIFTDIDKINPDGAILSENALSVVDSWIDTGSYALNAICSGSLYGGVPQGRIVGVSGPSGCGKTLMMMKIVSNFQREDPDRWAIVFDSELAVDNPTALSLGVNTSQVKHYPVNTVGEVRNQILKVLNSITAKGLKGKFIIVVDSLGNLAGDKEVKDAEEDKFASDMGTRAKGIKSMLRVLTYKAAKAKTTILFSNHEYSDPTAMYETLIKSQSGGEGPIYMSSLLLQLGFKREKNEKDYEREAILAAAKKIGGITMHVLTAKNRFIVPLLSTDIYLNFKTGVDKYSGLFELAYGLGLITGDKTYEYKGKKIGYRKEFERDPEFWKEAMPELEKLVTKEFKYSSPSEQLKQEVETTKKK